MKIVFVVENVTESNTYFFDTFFSIFFCIFLFKSFYGKIFCRIRKIIIEENYLYELFVAVNVSVCVS